MVESKAAVQPSTTMDAPDLSKQPATDWDEAQIRKSLATLEQLQDQVTRAPRGPLQCSNTRID